MESLFLPQWRSFLRYHDLPGENPTRVYLPGLGGPSSASFINVVANPLMAGYRSLLVDFLGSGFSDQPGEFSYSLEDHAHTVAELLDHVGAKDCMVIGHSHGGSVGIVLADLRPDLVSQLIVAEGNLDPGGGLFSRQVAAQSEREFIERGYRTLLEGIIAEAIRGDKGLASFAGILQIAAPYAIHRGAVSLVEATQPTLRERFYQLRIPCAYIYGERSVPHDAASALPDAPDPNELVKQGIRVFVVPNAGHGMTWDNPTGFAHALKEALNA